MDYHYNLGHYNKLQLLEMSEHRHLLSERKGYDVGGNTTALDWYATGHAHRFKMQYMDHLDECEILAIEYEGRPIPKRLVHIAMHDSDPELEGR